MREKVYCCDCTHLKAFKGHCEYRCLNPDYSTRESTPLEIKIISYGDIWKLNENNDCSGYCENPTPYPPVKP